MQLAYDKNNIQEGASMWVLPHYIKKTLANMLDSRMCAEGLISTFSVSGRDDKQRQSEWLRCYSEVTNNFLKQYATDQAAAENDALIRQ